MGTLAERVHVEGFEVTQGAGPGGLGGALHWARTSQLRGSSGEDGTSLKADEHARADKYSVVTTFGVRLTLLMTY